MKALRRNLVLGEEEKHAISQKNSCFSSFRSTQFVFAGAEEDISTAGASSPLEATWKKGRGIGAHQQ